MHLSSKTCRAQSNLANYYRTGILPEIPGINQDKVTQYRRLVYNTIEDILESAYPLTRDLLSDLDWEEIVNDFFANHSCKTPLIWSMPKEFYEYLCHKNHIILLKFPFLKDLLWFEWIETELFMMEDLKVAYNEKGTLFMDKLVLNPEHQILSFEYPVHLKKPSEITANDKGNYFVIAHRNLSGDVHFTNVSIPLAKLIEYLAQAPQTIKEMIDLLQLEYRLETNVDFKFSKEDYSSIISFFKNVYQQDLIIGFKN